ncbi:MAG: chromosomal replication initiator protein DnaA [Ruminococcaceae bacterium]|nr:chromosomal replication initiator protein DnaA [Oscillospiraceae bacterium]
MNSVSDVWKSVIDIMGTKLTQTALSTWFDDCQAVDLLDERLVIYTPTPFKRDIIENRFSSMLSDALMDIFSCRFDIMILAGDELDTYMQHTPSAPSGGHDGDNFTFDRFVVGSSNKFAHAAAMAVAAEETKNFNPLFIYGESGLGKTHLLYAIRNEIKKKHPDFHIVYVRGDEFTSELINAIQSGKNVEFREKYRKADLFLMDDIQFIAGKTSTQEEFFHTFNSLYEANKQIVFTSDRPPNEITLLTDRLKTRFESGLLADIQPPDFETRMAIIKNKALEFKITLPDDVMTYIANNLTSNVRQIEGAVKKIMAVHDLIGDDINVTSVSKIIKDMFKENAESVPTADLIIDETAKYFSLTTEELKSQRRSRNIAMSRQTAMYLIRKLTNLSFKDIGNYFDGRDHTTVMTSVQKIEDLIKKDRKFNQTIKDITANINAQK